MAYAIDLSPRQTTRTLEQAVRHRAEILLQPRVQPDDELIACRLERVETPQEGRGGRGYLEVAVLYGEVASDGSADDEQSPKEMGAPGRGYEELIGTYCDAALQLGENRYLFCSDVLAAWNPSKPGGSACIRLARPETIQVTQRRRFWRFVPARSAQVNLSYSDGEPVGGSGMGWLCNVSADGLACRVDSRLADHVGIGEHLKVEFALAPGDPVRFRLDAALCNKIPAGTQGTMILGLQFMVGPGYEASARAGDTLRRQLLARYSQPVPAQRS